MALYNIKDGYVGLFYCPPVDSDLGGDYPSRILNTNTSIVWTGVENLRETSCELVFTISGANLPSPYAAQYGYQPILVSSKTITGVENNSAQKFIDITLIANPRNKTVLEYKYTVSGNVNETDKTEYWDNLDTPDTTSRRRLIFFTNINHKVVNGLWESDDMLPYTKDYDSKQEKDDYYNAEFFKVPEVKNIIKIGANTSETLYNIYCFFTNSQVSIDKEKRFLRENDFPCNFYGSIDTKTNTLRLRQVSDSTADTWYTNFNLDPTQFSIGYYEYNWTWILDPNNYPNPKPYYSVLSNNSTKIFPNDNCAKGIYINSNSGIENLIGNFEYLHKVEINWERTPNKIKFPVTFDNKIGTLFNFQFEFQKCTFFGTKEAVFLYSGVILVDGLYHPSTFSIPEYIGTSIIDGPKLGEINYITWAPITMPGTYPIAKISHIDTSDISEWDSEGRAIDTVVHTMEVTQEIINNLDHVAIFAFCVEAVGNTKNSIMGSDNFDSTPTEYYYNAPANPGSNYSLGSWNDKTKFGNWFLVDIAMLGTTKLDNLKLNGYYDTTLNAGIRPLNFWVGYGNRNTFYTQPNMAVCLANRSHYIDPKLFGIEFLCFPKHADMEDLILLDPTEEVKNGQGNPLNYALNSKFVSGEKIKSYFDYKQTYESQYKQDHIKTKPDIQIVIRNTSVTEDYWQWPGSRNKELEIYPKIHDASGNKSTPSRYKTFLKNYEGGDKNRKYIGVLHETYLITIHKVSEINLSDYYSLYGEYPEGDLLASFEFIPTKNIYDQNLTQNLHQIYIFTKDTI